MSGKDKKKGMAKFKYLRSLQIDSAEIDCDITNTTFAVQQKQKKASKVLCDFMIRVYVCLFVFFPHFAEDD